MMRQTQKTSLIRPTEKVYLISLLIGVMTGFIAVLITLIMAHVENLLLSNLSNTSIKYAANEYHIYYAIKVIVGQHGYLLFIPGIGAFLGGLITHRYAPDAKGSGTEAVIDAFHNNEGKIKPFTPFVKAVATIFTLGSGGCGGKEGPMTQVGAGFGSLFARWFRMGTRARRTFLLAGAAGGLGALFKAPLGGALTAIEVLYKEDIETDSLVPCIIASTTGYITYSQCFGYERLFDVKGASFEGFNYLTEAIFYVILGIMCVLFGKLYVLCFHTIQRKIFEPLRVHAVIKPLIGGLMVGIIGFFYKDSIGSGMGVLQDIFSEKGAFQLGSFHREETFLLLKVCVLLALLRTLNTSFTIGSGGSGGIFVPSLVVGGLIGAAFGCVYHLCFPSAPMSLSSFTIVGMGGFFAGVANAPIASMVMVTEITGAYHLLPPLMVVSIIGVIFSKRHSIYTNQVPNRFESPAHLWDMQVNVLKEVRIIDLIRQGFVDKKPHPNVVQENTSLSQLKQIAHKTQSSYFIVLDKNKHYLGSAVLSPLPATLDPSLIAYDLIDDKQHSLQVHEHLPEAIEMMSNHNLHRLAVLDKQRFITTLEYKSILQYTQKKMKQHAPLITNKS